MWSRTLPIPKLDQLTVDPNVEQRYNDCGPTSTSMIAEYITGKFWDPMWIVDSCPDYGNNYYGYTGWDIDYWFWNNVVKAPYEFANTPTIEAMENFLTAAIKAGHGVKGLFYFSAPNANDGHFRVVKGSYYKKLKGVRMWQTNDPWTGAEWDQTSADLFNWSQNQWLDVKAAPHVISRPIVNQGVIDKYKKIQSILNEKPHPVEGKGLRIERNMLKECNQVKGYNR